ncbi:MAG: vanadium-dependent haloperoxidase, partial [Pseudomonadota bacterium]
MAVNRRSEAYRRRVDAAQLARDRVHPPHLANGDEQRWSSSNYAMCFTKGLPHSAATGLIEGGTDFEAFRRAIDEGLIDAFTLNVPTGGPGPHCTPERKWEAPTAGIVYDLEGPDAQAVTMPPAPPLGSAELAYEMAEVYELALLRDAPLTDLRGLTEEAPDSVRDAVERLNDLSYKPAAGQGRPRKTDGGGGVTAQTVFRGSSPGVEVGPYLSQFMLIGNDDLRGTDTAPDAVAVESGRIQFGANLIDQRVPVAAPTDWMTTRSTWLSVQQGADVRNNATLFDQTVPRRFITTPRDLATYVHDDALYQAYLNACLILLSMGAPFDRGFAQLSGQRDPYRPGGAVPLQATGFALYGGPHILTLVTEVATRALKAVRHQKFNVHIRLRPEALAGRIDYAMDGSLDASFPAAAAAFRALEEEIHPTVEAVRAATGTRLLPMAFQEGSPMHPAYGAGHATVAGACVTVLKAFFDTSTPMVSRARAGADAQIGFLAPAEAGEVDTPIQYVATEDGASLAAEEPGTPLTLEGELNKLAANISIGRNMGGVHYFTDYFDSLRMGEEIAIGML